MITKYNLYNESLKDKIKGKSNDDILKNTENLSLYNKLINGCKYGILPLVKQTIKDGIDPSIYNNEAIRYATSYGHLDVVKLLLKDDRVDPSDNFNELICIASDNGYLEIVKELLKDKRVNPSASYNYPICMASQNGHLEIVKELLKDKRINPESHDNYPIKQSIENGHLEITKVLQDHIKNDNINESLKDKLTGKSEDDIKKSLDDLSPSQKLRKIEQYNLKHLFTDEEFIKILKRVFYTTPSYFFNELKYTYDKSSELLSDKEIKEGIVKYARELNKILYNPSLQELSNVLYYLYKKNYLFDHFDSLRTAWFKHISKGPYSGGHTTVDKFTKLEDTINYVERMEELDH